MIKQIGNSIRIAQIVSGKCSEQWLNNLVCMHGDADILVTWRLSMEPWGCRVHFLKHCFVRRSRFCSTVESWVIRSAHVLLSPACSWWQQAAFYELNIVKNSKSLNSELDVLKKVSRARITVFSAQHSSRDCVRELFPGTKSDCASPLVSMLVARGPSCPKLLESSPPCHPHLPALRGLVVVCSLIKAFGFISFLESDFFTADSQIIVKT